MNASASVFQELVFSTPGATPLNGVLTLSRQAHSDGGPMLVLLNSGLLHQVGSSGLSVRLAREVATHGMHAARFDHSGIGDSLVRTATASYSDRVVAEVTEVLDQLQHRGLADSFILCGLCSGAYTSLAAAVVDPRIVGIAQIAPWSYRTTGWYLHLPIALLHRFSTLTRTLRKRLRRRLQVRSAGNSMVVQFGDEGSDPARVERQTLIQNYGSLFARGGRALVVMTRSEHQTYNHQGQFARLLAPVLRPGALSEYFFPETRHIVTEPQDQRAIVKLISDWALERQDS